MRTIPQTPFAGDDGAPEPSVREALARTERDPGAPAYLTAVAELCLTRLLVPVQASGATADEHSALSVVLLQAGSRTGMLAFTGLDALHRWDPRGRPVLTTLDAAAASAVADGADTLLVDVAGPHPLEVDGEVLHALAQGHRLVALPDRQFGWAVPQAAEGDITDRRV